MLGDKVRNHSEEEDQQHDRSMENLPRSLVGLYFTVVRAVIVRRRGGFVDAVVIGEDVGCGGCRGR